MACCWLVNFTVSFILGVRCATVIPFAPYGSAIIAWTQKTLHPHVKRLGLKNNQFYQKLPMDDQRKHYLEYHRQYVYMH